MLQHANYAVKPAFEIDLELASKTIKDVDLDFTVTDKKVAAFNGSVELEFTEFIFTQVSY